MHPHADGLGDVAMHRETIMVERVIRIQARCGQASTRKDIGCLLALWELGGCQQDRCVITEIIRFDPTTHKEVSHLRMSSG